MKKLILLIITAGVLLYGKEAVKNDAGQKNMTISRLFRI